MECSVMNCEPLDYFKRFHHYEKEIEQLRTQLENVKLQGLNGTDIKSYFHFHNNKACIENKCSEITSNQNKSIVLRIENKEKLPLPELDQETTDDLQDMFKRMSLSCPFSFTLKIGRPEFVTENWLKVSIQSNKANLLPNNWRNPYFVKALLPFDQLDFPYNQTIWKYCMEEFYYCEYVNFNCDNRKILKLYNNDFEVHIEEIEPSLECPNCYEEIRPGQLIKHIFDHLKAQLPKCDAYKYLCLHCLTPYSSSLELLKHQIMVENTVTRFCCMICNTCFISDEKRLKHMQTKHTFNCMPYICQSCPYRCSTAVQIAHHISNTHPDSITCPFCLTVFPNSTENCLIEDTESCSIEETENANEKIAEALENLYETVTNHLEAHLLNTYFFSCAQCQLTFNSKEELMKHIKCGHSETSYKSFAGHSLAPMILTPALKLVVQKYNKRSKLAVFVNSELPIEELGIRKVVARKFKKRFHQTQDFLIDYPLLKHLLEKKYLLKRRARKFIGKKRFAKFKQTSESDEESDQDITELNFLNCYASEEVSLVKPKNEFDQITCNECLKPFSKIATEINLHLSAEIIVCDFPGCFFKTMCFNAFQMHNHEDLGTRKMPLVLLKKQYTCLSSKNHLWICTNCAEYFTDFKSLAHHVYKKNHICFSALIEFNETNENLSNNLISNCV